MCAGFLRAAEANDYDKAAQYLDGKRSPKQSEELASELKYLLDQGMSTSIDDLSRSPNGNIEDQLRLSREYIGTVKTPNGDFKLMLDLVKRPEQPSVWLFSQETLNLVPHAYASMQHTDYEHFFPAWASSIRIESVPLWRWVVIFLSLLFGFGIASVLTKSVLWSLRRAFRKRLSVEVEASALALKMPIFCLMLAFIAYGQWTCHHGTRATLLGTGRVRFGVCRCCLAVNTYRRHCHQFYAAAFAASNARSELH